MMRMRQPQGELMTCCISMTRRRWGTSLPAATSAYFQDSRSTPVEYLSFPVVDTTCSRTHKFVVAEV